uniref:Uncharacterized protein n=1 Tax=Rhizophora mucronata TaxID=61149 RepID=A0A2P2J571_RHIMU
MAPTRKKSVNKRFLHEVSPDKEARNSYKSKQPATGKRKFSDKLGRQWSNEELQRFYNAYRRYGKDWKKVASELRNRSAEMVEALFNMNQAYLSLPEGVASVFGLIAMMTDHYTVLEASDSEQVSNEMMGMSQKPLKQKRAKVEHSASKDFLQSSVDGCFSLLKRAHLNGGQPRAVRKRTPRVPITYMNKRDDEENTPVLNTKGRKSNNNDNDDEVVHDAALALAEASHRGSSPQVSQTPQRRTKYTDLPPIRSWDKMFSRSESVIAMSRDASLGEDQFEGDTGTMGADMGTHPKDMSSLTHMEGFGTVEVHQKGKKCFGKKLKVEETGNNISDDGEGACSGTEGGLKFRGLRVKACTEVSNAKSDETSPSGPQSNKKLFSGDEVSDLGRLETLANASVMESESSIQLNKERSILDVDDKSTAPKAGCTRHPRDKNKPLGQKENVLPALGGVESTASRKSKLRRHSTTYAKSVSEANQPSQLMNNNNNMLKRKHQSLASKVPDAEGPLDYRATKLLETEALNEEKNAPVAKGKHVGQFSASSKQEKSVGGLEGSLSSGQKNVASNLAVPTAQVPFASQSTLQTKRSNRRKTDLKISYATKEDKCSENIVRNQANKLSSTVQDRVIYLKEKLSCCLSSSLARRWCTFEWFYSAIDYPWFAKREFVEYLNHVGLGHIPRLSRVEWGVIRSSLGKPRRFSEHFLQEERDKLQQYRQSVRKHYTELHNGTREGLPTDLARPLSVGQQVIALHPRTREFHDGSVLTVDHDRCRVQFDCPEIGVEFVKDIDCMPLNPLDNMPEALRTQRFSLMTEEAEMNGHSYLGGISSIVHLEDPPSPMNTSTKQAQVDTDRAIAQTKPEIVNARELACNQPSLVTKLRPNQAEIQALSGPNHVLDKKASSTSFNLRQHINYSGNTLPAWLKPPTKFGFPGSLPSFHESPFASQESGSTVVELVRGSRSKAHTMVDAAFEAISSLKEGQDAFLRIGEALDSIDRRQKVSESKVQVTRSPEPINGSFRHHNQLISRESVSQVNDNAFMARSHDDSGKTEAAFPSELITSCVATLLMIQACTERQYPPADVAQMIDSAVTTLHPCCPQNHSVYREIQTCMGRIKTQILALIPT